MVADKGNEEIHFTIPVRWDESDTARAAVETQDEPGYIRISQEAGDGHKRAPMQRRRRVRRHYAALF